MGLFTNPVTLTDGTNNHVFEYRAQRFDARSMIGDYIEPAAAAESASLLTVKQDLTKQVQRHLVQRSIYLTPAADTESDPLRVTINVSVTCDKKFVHTEVQPQLNIVIDGMAEANFLRNLMNGML